MNKRDEDLLVGAGFVAFIVSNNRTKKIAKAQQQQQIALESMMTAEQKIKYERRKLELQKKESEDTARGIKIICFIFGISLLIGLVSAFPEACAIAVGLCAIFLFATVAFTGRASKG